MFGVEHTLRGGVQLKALGVQHAEELFALIDRNRDRLRQWLPWVDSIRSVEDEANFLRMMEDQRAKEVAFVSGIFVDGKVAGSVGVHPVDRANRKVMLGYWIGAEYQGKGLVTSACRVVVSHLFREVGMNRITIYCATGNPRSRAIAERLGFELEGIHRDAEWINDHFVDLACYAMLARDWKM